LVSNPSSNPTLSTNPNPKGHNRRRSKQRIEEFNLDELSPPIVTMVDQRTMAQLLQAPTEGYEDAIVVPVITANNLELKHEGAVRIWLEKEPPRSIFTWDDLVLKFINQFFPPSKTTNLRNEITNFQQHFDESFSEAWDRFKYLLRASPHHGFLKLHQLDTFYNALNSKDQDSLNSAAGDMVKVLLLDKKSQNQAPATVKAVEESSYVKPNDAVMRNMQTQGQNMQNQLTNLTDLLTKFLNSNNASTSSSGTLPSNIIATPRSDLKAITTRSGVSYDGPQIPPPTSFLPKVVKNEPEVTKDTVHPTNNGSTEDVQPQVVQSKSPILSSKRVNSPTIKPVASPFSASRPNLRPSIPYPSRMQDQKLCDKANDQCENIFQIFNDLNFNISFAEALILMPKFCPSIKILLTNKDKLCELARTPLNEHCSAVYLKKLPEKLEDPGKFLIPCDFLRKAECLALVDLGARINLMLLSVWNKLSLPDLTPTCMTLDLVDRSISRPIGVAEDVYVKVEVELKDLPPHLEYAFLEGDDKFQVLIPKYFSVEEKTALITVLKSHKRVIA
nr:reverse transcriptase domain-containing protein [Tanacetum cinerariifolium]